VAALGVLTQLPAQSVDCSKQSGPEKVQNYCGGAYDSDYQQCPKEGVIVTKND
jgi:hypothetical protein